MHVVEEYPLGSLLALSRSPLSQDGLPLGGESQQFVGLLILNRNGHLVQSVRLPHASLFPRKRRSKRCVNHIANTALLLILYSPLAYYFRCLLKSHENLVDLTFIASHNLVRINLTL